MGTSPTVPVYLIVVTGASLRGNVIAARSFRTASRLGLATTLLMSGLMVVGSLVRSTGSGLACPDWPLCGGQLVPPFEFHVLIEWFHRLVALLVSVALVATVAWVATHRAVRARLGGLAALAVALLAVQILLGALTVWRLLSPAIVGSHLGVALLLFCTMLALTLGARAEAAPERGAAAGPPAARAPRLLGITTLAAFAQGLLGGIVSATHAGTVCRDWPTCNGVLFPPLNGLVGLHMLHRYGAYTLLALVATLAWRARRSPDSAIRRGARAALLLVLLQVVLGVANVMLGVPPWLTAGHLATAIAVLAVLLTTTLRAAPLAAPAIQLVPAEAR